MKLAFLIDHLDPARGGAETYVAGLATECSTRSHEVHVVTRNAANAARTMGAELHLVDTSAATAWGRTLSFDRAAAKVVHSIGADVVLGVGKTTSQDVFQPHGGTYRGTLRQNCALVTGAFARPIRRARSALSIKEHVYLDIERRQYDAPDVEFVALSRMVKADMINFYNVDEERIHLAYNGVDTERFSPEGMASLREKTRADLGISQDEIVLLIVAHNFKLKGVATLIRATAFLRGELPVRTVIVGGGRISRYRRLALSLGTSQGVHFAGPADMVDPFYAAADIYCQPTWYDPCSLVVLEAIACGLPVITTQFNGAGELLTQGREGYVMEDPADHEELAQCVRKLADKAVREWAGKAARELALQHTLERNFQEMIEVFRIAAEKGRAGR